MSEGLKIVSLTSENVKKLTAVEITPDGSLVIIGGKNGSGKTSVLDSIKWALGGQGTIDPQPIRNGEDTAKIVIKLDGDKQLVVERRITESGSTLEIRNGEGFKASSPQTLLDQLCGKIAFDPLEFARMAPAKQAETLRGLVGLDFSKIDDERRKLFDKRTLVNRDAKALKAEIDANPIPADAPTGEVSIASLVDEANHRRAVNKYNAEKRAVPGYIRKQLEKAGADQDSVSADIVRLERELKEKKDQLSLISVAIDCLNNDIKRAEDVCTALADLDVAEIEEQIKSAGAVNEAFRKVQATKALMKRHEAKQEESISLSVSIAELDASKQNQLAAASWPIDGLGFSESGVTFNGFPLEQSSSAEQTKISVAIGLALNPRLRVLLIRDGSLLDEESMAVIAQMAKDADAQFWIERVGEGAECSVIIEDGHVKETR